ncbi:MAG: hypothetical protein DYH15_01900 [Nitrosomonas sp. PRO4]|nr:hypothetical protein [Nitrosomonas sp. PRO4]
MQIISRPLHYFKLLKLFFIFSLGICWQPLVIAETIENLQKNASIAYEQMIQAKRSAETLAKDLAFAEKQLASMKQKVTTTEREVEISRKKYEDAKISLEQATNRWKQATDVLANEWERVEKND